MAVKTIQRAVPTIFRYSKLAMVKVPDVYVCARSWLQYGLGIQVAISVSHDLRVATIFRPIPFQIAVFIVNVSKWILVRWLLE